MASIRRRDRGQYQVRIRRLGYPDLCKTLPTREAAETWARQQEARMDVDGWTDPRESYRLTVYDALNRYAREFTPGKKGAKQELARIRAWQARPLAKVAIGRVRSADIAEERDRMLDREVWRGGEWRRVSTGTVRRDLAVLPPVWAAARDEWRMEGLGDPFEGVRFPPPGAARERRLAPGEERALRETGDVIQCAYLTVALETGMRRSELLGMRRERIDELRRVAHLPDTKISEARDVPLSSRAMEALKALPVRFDGAIWPWGSEGAASMWARWLRRAGVQGLTFHDLRHEAVSRLIEGGRLTLTQVSAITGHKDMQTLRRYANHRASDLARLLG
ncbi:MAG: tyrosine-type recombinase/integrase [Halomonas sp.]